MSSADEPQPDSTSDAPVGLDRFYDRPSKTQRKKQSHELQGLGEALVALADSKLAKLPMPEYMLDALLAYKRTKTHEGKRRQMQYIGKLMRRLDAGPLQEAVAASQLGRATDALALHDAERWRAELVADDEAIVRFRTEHPETDLQQLRSLVRAARKDAAAAPEQRNGRAFRDLFRFIRSFEAPAASHAQDEADADTDTDEDDE